MPVIHTTPSIARPYIVMSSASKMPNSCWGSYRHVAIVLTDGATRPAMISTRARGVRKIVHETAPQHVGSTDRCAYQIALAAAHRAVALRNSLTWGCPV
jgi:hypothetical protein